MLNSSGHLKSTGSLEDAKSFDLRDIINFLWRQWKLIGGVVILTLLIGGIFLIRQVPVYTASVQVLLNTQKEKAAGQDSILTEANLDLAAIESQMAIIRSSVLLKRVVEKEKLVNDPEFGSAPASVSWSLGSAFKSVFSGSDSNSKAPDTNTPQKASSEITATVENLKTGLQVRRAGQAAYVMEISFTSVDAAKAARLANAIADAYVVDKLDARFDAAKRASGWLTERLEELRKQLRESEQAVADFRSENKLVQAGTGATLNQEQLGQMNTRLVTARAETAERKARLDLLEKVKARGGSLAALPDAVASPAVAQLRQQEADASRREADLLARYSDRHPSVVNLRAEIGDIRRAIAAEVQRISANIANEYELARARQDAVEKTLREVTGMTDLDNSKTIALRELERTAAVNKSLFEDFLQRARITEEQSSFAARDARIITPALSPTSPSAPKKAQYLLATLVLGLLAGVGLAFAVEHLNAGFTTSRELEEMLELPMLASISHMHDRELQADGQQITLPLLPLQKPLSRISEAIRALRSGVQMSNVDNPPKVVQFTSTVPGEGKTTIALTFATSAAQSGLRVILIDGDLRHPSSSRFFGREKEIGLVDYLAGEAKIETVVKFQENTRYWMLPAGSKTQNPPDLLGSERWKTLIAMLREKFDLVIIDTPPMGPVIDPSVVSRVADKIVYVVRWSSTARELVQQAIHQLNGSQQIAGIVFNHVNDQQAQKYGKYAYSYYYGSRYYKRYYSEET